MIERNDDLTIIFLKETPDITPDFFSVMSEDIEILLPCNVDLEAYLYDLEDRGYTSLMDNVTVAEHVWNDGEITTPATCSAVGVKTFTCTHNSEHTRTEDVAIVADAHSFGDWKAEIPATTEKEGTKAHKTCALCQKHFDANGNEMTDLAIAKLTPTTTEPESTPPTSDELENDGLSGGAIVGVVAGSTATAGVGGFSLFWFVIKKKKWSDLFHK